MTWKQYEWLGALVKHNAECAKEGIPIGGMTKPLPTIRALGRKGYIDDLNKLYWWNGPSYVPTEKGLAALAAREAR